MAGNHQESGSMITGASRTESLLLVARDGQERVAKPVVQNHLTRHHPCFQLRWLEFPAPGVEHRQARQTAVRVGDVRQHLRVSHLPRFVDVGAHIHGYLSFQSTAQVRGQCRGVLADRPGRLEIGRPAQFSQQGYFPRDSAQPRFPDCFDSHG